MAQDNTRKKIALGMSGGVDSSVSAVLLQKAGYDVTGVFLECWRAPGCRAEEDRKDALAIALKLGIPFQVLDFKEAYRQKVVEYFFETYKAGKTPNPDVLCNKEIKFGLFYDWAMEQGFDAVATGHYAQIIDNALVRSVDEHKDQTYFLYRLREEQLSHVLFPIGHLTKPEVRKLAKEYELLTATKPDSQGICFIGEINVHNFLKDRLGENPGDVVDTKGRVIGRHKGLWFYTIGQRHGFDDAFVVKTIEGIDKHAIPPFYVIHKDGEKNQLVVGFGAETYKDTFEIEDIHWIRSSSGEDDQKLMVRIRHTGQLIPCTLKGNKINLCEAQQGVASGQSAVFYHQDTCYGGGIII
ncbi:MAG: tRNA 2-thiouridine(34) synthase MnmA [Candidatus Woesebacteria bacterium]